MKTPISLLVALLFFSIRSNAQDVPVSHIPLLGEMAPEFTAESTQGKIKFPDDFFMKWKVLFSHPADFTPVCSTELLELARLQDEFEKLDTKILVLSTDGLESHLEWIRALESIRYKKGKPISIHFSLITDKNLEISRKFGMIHSFTSNTRDVRGVFIIDPNDRIRAIFFYPNEIGRNLDEILRTVVALQTAESKDVLVPANWNPGDDFLIRAPKSRADADRLSSKKDPELYSLTWFLWFLKAE
jgi:peroxiredoxin (alkyl hydroperoxide reductase subunit C)